MITTNIKKTENGHQLSFSIGVQTFYLKEQKSQENYTSLERCKWYEKQLKVAFENLNISDVKSSCLEAEYNKGWNDGYDAGADK